VRHEQQAEFERFAAAQLTALLRPAYYLTGDWHTAHDVVQATLVKMYGHWSRLPADADRVAYARTTLLNVHRDELRRVGRRRALRQQPYHPPDVDVVERDYQRDLLMALPPRQRAVVVLRFLEDLSVQQTADCLSVSTGTVKSQTADALQALRTAIETVGGTHGRA
jgi:RNA polymerase sigma-70 factor (sigma-E family)